MGAMCAGGLGSAVREPCAEPVTGGDDENAGTQRRKAATQEGGREGQGRRADQSREERAGANAPGTANEPTEAQSQERRRRARGGSETQRRVATADRSRGTAFPRRERRDRSAAPESQKNEVPTRPDRIMERKHVEVVCEASSRSSGWP